MNSARFFQLTFGMAAWATLYPLTKLLGGSVDPFVLAFVRYAIAGVIFLVILYRSKIRAIRSTDWARVLLLAFIGTALTTVLITKGVVFSSASASSILVNTSPLIVALIAPFVLQEKTTAQQLIGIGIGVIGVLLVVKAGAPSINTRYGAGALLLLLAAGCQAVYAIGLRPLLARYGSLQVTTLMAVVGTIELIPLLVASAKIRQLTLLNPTQWLLLIFIGVISTAVGSYLWIHSLSVLSTTSSTSFKLLIPMFATLYAVILGEPLTLGIMGGIVCTTVGIALAQGKYS